MKRVEQDKNSELRTIKRAPLIDLTLEELNSSIIIDGGTESLLERLEVNKVIANQGEYLDSNNLFPVTNELIYNYDFGDNWIIKITKYSDCEDLLGQNIVAEYELEEAKRIVLDKHKPVCINREGLSVLDDVGGLSGFADLLGLIYEGEDMEESSNALAWAKSLGWSSKKVSIKRMI
ncbi:IS1096 element passenger TnpR family protein [Gudongella sp. SC589]|jgi:hypothetical protein|uniref:IS1096 element passenger TnpR family protein n=1 Tax=Gudongella sp. SC589 TaxID=3385990 RepID=UPI0039049A51